MNTPILYKEGDKAIYFPDTKIVTITRVLGRTCFLDSNTRTCLMENIIPYTEENMKRLVALNEAVEVLHKELQKVMVQRQHFISQAQKEGV